LWTSLEVRDPLFIYVFHVIGAIEENGAQSRANARHLGEKMEIHLNITFPRLPCELLTLDVMDVSGEQQTGVVHGINKVRLSPQAEGGRVIDVEALEL